MPIPIIASVLSVIPMTAVNGANPYRFTLRSPSGVLFEISAGNHFDPRSSQFGYQNQAPFFAQKNFQTIKLPAILANAIFAIQYDKAQADDKAGAIARSSQAVVRHIMQGGYSAVITSGRSASIALALFISAWQAIDSARSPPPVYLFDPIANKMLYDEVFPLCPDRRVWPEERESYVDEYVRTFFPEFFDMKDKSLMWIDDIAKTGDKLSLIEKLFNKFGFNDLEFATFIAARSSKLPESTFVGRVDEAVIESLSVSDG